MRNIRPTFSATSVSSSEVGVNRNPARALMQPGGAPVLGEESPLDSGREPPSIVRKSSRMGSHLFPQHSSLRSSGVVVEVEKERRKLLTDATDREFVHAKQVFEKEVRRIALLVYAEDEETVLQRWEGELPAAAGCALPVLVFPSLASSFSPVSRDGREEFPELRDREPREGLKVPWPLG